MPSPPKKCAVALYIGGGDRLCGYKNQHRLSKRLEAHAGARAGYFDLISTQVLLLALNVELPSLRDFNYIDLNGKMAGATAALNYSRPTITSRCRLMSSEWPVASCPLERTLPIDRTDASCRPRRKPSDLHCPSRLSWPVLRSSSLTETPHRHSHWMPAAWSSRYGGEDLIPCGPFLSLAPRRLSPHASFAPVVGPSPATRVQHRLGIMKAWATTVSAFSLCRKIMMDTSCAMVRAVPGCMLRVSHRLGDTSHH